MAKKKKAPNGGTQDKWTTLQTLIVNYADTQEAYSWAGGGDPSDVPVLKAQLELARVQLFAHIEKMRQEEK